MFLDIYVYVFVLHSLVRFSIIKRDCPIRAGVDIISKHFRGTHICHYQIYFGNRRSICQRKLFVCYQVSATPLLVNVVDCYLISQLSHKSVRSCSVLWQKEVRIYEDFSVSLTLKKFLI